MKRNIFLLLTGIFASVNVSAQQETVAANSEKETLNLGRNVTYNLKEGTGAVNTASSEKLSHKTSINVTNQFYGMLPGLQAMQQPGEAWNERANLYVRGMGTLNNKAPLIIVDGFERSLSDFTPEEIESVTVLKDAVATSIYGMRGANGVIVVETKRGKAEKAEVGFSYTFNMATPNRLPEFVDSYTYANALNEALANDGKPARYDEYALEGFKNGTNPEIYPNVDWVDETLRNIAFGDNINFYAQGKGSHVNYYTMLNFIDSRGILQPVNENDGFSTQHKYSRLNVRTNLDIKMTETTKVKLNFLGVFDEHNRPNTSTNTIFDQIYRIPSAAFPVKTSRGIWARNETYGDNNPVALIADTGYSRGQHRSLLADFHLNQRLDMLVEGLSLGVKVGIDNSASYWDGNKKAFGTEEAYLDANGEVAYKKGRDEGNFAFSKSVGHAKTHFNFEGYADYSRTWGKHALNAALTYSMDKIQVKDRNEGRAFIDVTAQAHYAYANKYLVDFTLGSTASSVFEKGNQWGVMPAVGLGWVISNENFMKADWVDFLKLRTSFGVVGIADYGLDLWRDVYGAGGNGYNFGTSLSGASGKHMGHLGIENFTYEKSHKFNFGVDFQAFKKLTFSMDAFFDHRTDILVSGVGGTSAILGIAPAQENAGVVNNYGVEALVGWDDKIGEVKYHIGGNFSFVRNEIKEMNEEYRPEKYLFRTGQSIGQIYGYEVVGIYKTQDMIDNRDVVQKLGPVKVGDLMYKDQNGDKVIDAYDQVPLGYNSSCPEIYYTFDLGVEYKGIGLYAMFQGAGHYSKILNTRSLYRPIVGDNNISDYYYANRWHAENNPNGTLPRLTYEGSDNNYATNSLWVADASFLKLRTLELYYNVPTKAIAKYVPLSKFKVFARANDLFCADKIDLQDPEAMGAVHPTMTQYSFGFNLTF